MDKFILFLQRCLLISVAVGFFTQGALQAEELYSPREKLVLMKEQISRDLEKAEELRGQAMTQKARLQDIANKAETGSRDPNMDPEVFQKVLAAAPQGLIHAEETLAKTEKVIQELKLKQKYTERAIQNLGSDKEPKTDNPEYDLGFGMVITPSTKLSNVSILRHGQSEPASLGEGGFLPGDEIITDSHGQIAVSSLGSHNYLITIASETRLKLEQDHKTKGTIWNLSKGKVHCREIVSLETAPAQIVTPDAVVNGGKGSRFDVRVDEKNQTFVEVYQGKVEIEEPKKGTNYFVEAGPEAVNLPRWWEGK